MNRGEKLKKRKMHQRLERAKRWVPIDEKKPQLSMKDYKRVTIFKFI